MFVCIYVYLIIYLYVFMLVVTNVQSPNHKLRDGSCRIALI